MSKYLANVTCIYLDQFAISNLSENEAWNEILKLLKMGIKKGVILIPYSMEHVLESSQKEINKAKRIDQFLFELSSGHGFEIEVHIYAKLLISAIRKRTISKTVYLKKYSYNRFQNETEINYYKGLKEIYGQMHSEGTKMLNDLRAAIRTNQKFNFSNLDDHVRSTSLNYQKEIEIRLKKYFNYGFYDKKPLKFSMITIPFWADSLLELLLSNFKLTRKEAKKGQELLKKHGLMKIIPTIYVRTALETVMSIKQQKETINDSVDISRLSSAIPFADIILTDKSKAFDIKLLGLDKEFKTEIYSGTKIELGKFKKRLIDLIW